MTAEDSSPDSVPALSALRQTLPLVLVRERSGDGSGAGIAHLAPVPPDGDGVVECALRAGGRPGAFRDRGAWPRSALRAVPVQSPGHRYGS